MPSNLKRYYGSGDLHFVTTSCYRRQPFLGTAHGRDTFLSVLERMRRRYRFVVLGYVVMPEHVHANRSAIAFPPFCRPSS